MAKLGSDQYEVEVPSQTKVVYNIVPYTPLIRVNTWYWMNKHKTGSSLVGRFLLKFDENVPISLKTKGARLSHIWLTQTTLPWKRSRLLLSIPLSATKYRTIKSVRSVRPVSTKSTFRVWTSWELPLFYSKYHIYRFIFICYHPTNQWNWIKIFRVVFEKITIWESGSSEGPLFKMALELQNVTQRSQQFCFNFNNTFQI